MPHIRKFVTARPLSVAQVWKQHFRSKPEFLHILSCGNDMDHARKVEAFAYSLDYPVISGIGPLAAKQFFLFLDQVLEKH
jgi:hypothetical protein